MAGPVLDPWGMGTADNGYDRVVRAGVEQGLLASPSDSNGKSGRHDRRK